MGTARKLVVIPELFQQSKDYFGFCETFERFNPASPGPLFAVEGTTPTRQTAPGCGLSCATNTTDNNASGVRTAYEMFKMTEGKDIAFETILTLTEATTTGGVNFVAGLFDANTAAAMLGNDGAGIPTATNWQGAIFYGYDGSTSLFCAAADAAASKSIEILSTDLNNLSGQNHLLSSANKRTLRVEISANGPGRMLAAFSINGLPIAGIELATASAATMNAGALVKTGSTNAQTMVLEKLMAVQAR